MIAVLDDPQWQRATTHNTVYATTVDGRPLAVVIVEDRTLVVVVAVWWEDDDEE